MILATVSSEPGFHSDVRTTLDRRYRFEEVWGLGYEDAPRLHAVKADQQCVAIVDFSVRDRALAFARTLGGRPQITTIALNGGDGRDELLLLMQAGVRDVLPHFTSRDLILAVNRALTLLGSSGEILADLHTFVPAKPGCGATTVATNASRMAAALNEEPMLLLDFDVRLGVTTFLLKTEARHTMVDALQQAGLLDREVWANLVSQVGNLHLLGSGASDFSQPFRAEQYRDLLDFAMRQYSSVAVDLPGSMEDFECEALLRSKRIFLVCTPDIGALHVARRKAQWFRDLRLTDTVSVVLNGVERRSTLSVAEIERVIELPVRYLLPAGAKDISRAVQRGEGLDPACDLGKRIAAIAAEMAPGNSLVKKPNPIRRFVEYFSVSAAREAVVPRS